MTTEQDERRLAEIREFVSPADTVTDRVFLLQIIDQSRADLADANERIRQLDAENQGFMREVAILNERIARLEGALGKFNEIVLRSNGVGKSELTVDIECADYSDAAELFDLIEDIAAIPATPAGTGEPG